MGGCIVSANEARALLRGLIAMLPNILVTLVGPLRPFGSNNFAPAHLAAFYLDLPLSIQSDVLNNLKHSSRSVYGLNFSAQSQYPITRLHYVQDSFVPK